MSAIGNSRNDRRPVLLIAVGRQRCGKTVFLNTTVQFVRAHGGNVVMWNADTMNRTHSLSLFHSDVLEPGSADQEDVKAWLEERFIDMVEKQYDALLDVGGGDTPLARLVDEVPIVSELEERGVRVVLVHLIGPERADLDYLERFLTESRLAPEATILVLNKGLVLSGRSDGVAFAEVRRHPAFLEAVGGGAVVATLPRLPCMSQVTDRGLTFLEAMTGIVKPGQAPMSFFDQSRVKNWWSRELPGFFLERIPSLWLPDMPALRAEVGEAKEARSRPRKAEAQSVEG
ncbi:MAG: zeta toxin family protein [Methylocystis silviterrae]|uniref:zeta toxin family protein n=1 Tax=Methylocystis silviterrae TaxID=2743612 RepID=UPI003C7425F3